MMPSVPDWCSYIRDNYVHLLLGVVCFNDHFLLLHFSCLLSFFLSEPRQHIEDRSFSRMRWPSSSVSKEVSNWDDKYIPIFPLTDMKRKGICCLCRCIHSYLHTCMLKHTCGQTRNPSISPLAAVCRIVRTQFQNLDVAKQLMRCFFMTVPLQHSWHSFCLMMQPQPEIFGCPILPA